MLSLAYVRTGTTYHLTEGGRTLCGHPVSYTVRGTRAATSDPYAVLAQANCRRCQRAAAKRLAAQA